MPQLVVIADQLVAPVPGGTGRYTAELVRALAETAPPGWTVGTVVGRRDDVAAAEIPGVAGPRALPVPRRVLVTGWQLGLPYWPGVDAVHAPTPLAPARRPGGTSLTVTVHDTVPWSHPETLTAHGVRWHRTVITRAMRRADVVFVPTDAVADELSVLFPAARPPLVVPHGVPRYVADRGADGVRRWLPRRYVLAIGTLEPRKGVDVLIDAIARMHAVDEHAPALVLIGQPGWGGLDPTELAHRHGVDGNIVRVLGDLADAELAEALRGAAAVAAPSRAEGFGLPVLEAMAAGVPVVHSDAPALVEVAGGAGVSVPRGDATALADALRRVTAEPALAGRLVDAGVRRARCFSWHAAAEAVWRVHAAGPHRVT